MADLRDMQNTQSYTGIEVSVVTMFMRQVYSWMTVGLAVTAGVAWYVANTPALLAMIFSSSVGLIALVIAQIGLVIWISAGIQRLSAFMATALFILYSALTGLTMSGIFIAYELGAIANAFMTAAGTFLAMSIYGAVTKRDLSAMGSFMIMGLFGIIIATIVNIFMQSALMDYIISGIGVIVFTGLTAYDTQKLREFAANAPINDATAIRRGVILGALTLYLDFINLFLMMLRFMGGNRD